MVFPFILYCKGKVALHNTNVWENHDFKNVISHDLQVQLFLKNRELL